MVITTLDIEYLSSILRPKQNIDLVYKINNKIEIYSEMVYLGFEPCKHGCSSCTLKHNMKVIRKEGKSDKFCLDDDLREIRTEDIIKINKVMEI